VHIYDREPDFSYSPGSDCVTQVFAIIDAEEWREGQSRVWRRHRPGLGPDAASLQ
jgi:hypothetical protein